MFDPENTFNELAIGIAKMLMKPTLEATTSKAVWDRQFTVARMIDDIDFNNNGNVEISERLDWANVAKEAAKQIAFEQDERIMNLSHQPFAEAFANYWDDGKVISPTEVSGDQKIWTIGVQSTDGRAFASTSTQMFEITNLITEIKE